MKAFYEASHGKVLCELHSVLDTFCRPETAVLRLALPLPQCLLKRKRTYVQALGCASREQPDDRSARSLFARSRTNLHSRSQPVSPYLTAFNLPRSSTERCSKHNVAFQQWWQLLCGPDGLFLSFVSWCHKMDFRMRPFKISQQRNLDGMGSLPATQFARMQPAQTAQHIPELQFSSYTLLLKRSRQPPA